MLFILDEVHFPRYYDAFYMFKCTWCSSSVPNLLKKIYIKKKVVHNIYYLLI